MAPLFCCSNAKPYRPRALTHESKFSAFAQWAAYPREAETQSSSDQVGNLSTLNPPYVIQLVKQVNFGPLESKRYFAVSPGADGEHAFVEVTESDLIEANYKKLNA